MFADNRQCAEPVLDVTLELRLCREHARKAVSVPCRALLYCLKVFVRYVHVPI